MLSLSAADTCSSVANADKIDCGFSGVTQASCEAKSCCWAEVNDYTTPWCFTAPLSSSGYELTSIKEVSTGLKGTLALIGEPSNTYGADITTLTLEILLEDADYAHFKIYDAGSSRWEVPQSVIPRPVSVPKVTTTNYDVTYTSSPFSITVTRKSDKAVVFSSAIELYFKDQYIEFTHNYDSSAVTFGLGESSRLTQPLSTDNAIYTLWAGDTPSMAMYTNLYSSFPMYLQMLGGMASGGMMMNSNGMDVQLSTNKLTYKMIGGIIDFYVFSGPTPGDVVAQYTSIVGRPMLQPYWSLGFHNCKYGYTSIQQVEEVVANYAAAGIPLDTQWVDIDYMQNYRDFTYDAVNFPVAEVNSFVQGLHTNGQKFVTIVDPGIMIVPGYDAYEQGLALDLYMKDIQGNPYLGQVWPGPTNFPDFFNPKSTDYWTTQLQQFHDLVPVDGIWIDMNEVSNFCNDDGKGQVCVNSDPKGCPAPDASQTQCCLVCSEVDPTNSYEYPPYWIHNNKGALSTKTTAVSGTQYNNISTYNAHNLYGITEAIATNAALVDIRTQRPFLLTRSAFMGSGAHTAKWTGDNAATFNDLKSSIVSILDFSLFGIPMIGADICGFIDTTTEELCNRWAQVGAFYPFSRNHNALGEAPQEFYLWETVTASAKKYLGYRYMLLPYMYTLFYSAHTTGKATVATALWMNYPDDTETLNVKSSQFMLGSGVLISPVVDQGATSVNAYFPANYWYNMDTYLLDYDTSAQGAYKTIDTPLTSTNVHIAGGTILPMQESAMTTALARQTPFTLVVALCPGGKSFGSLYWDNGEDVSPLNYLTAVYSAEITETENYVSGVVTAVGKVNSFESLSITSIIITGASDQLTALLSTKTSFTLTQGDDDNNKTRPVRDHHHNAVNAVKVSATTPSSITLETDMPITKDFKLTWA